MAMVTVYHALSGAPGKTNFTGPNVEAREDGEGGLSVIKAEEGRHRIYAKFAKGQWAMYEQREPKDPAEAEDETDVSDHVEQSGG